VSQAEELVADSIRAFNDADWETLERLWSPDGVVVAPAAWPEGGTFEGWPAIRAQFERVKADLSEDTITPLTIEEARPGTVVTAFRWAGAGAASGLAFDVPMWMVTTFRDELAVRSEYFQDEDAARAAAGG
jgi:ketosteroid isomerase-like protein